MFERDRFECLGQGRRGEDPWPGDLRSAEPSASYKIVKWTIITEPEKITLSVANPKQLSSRDRLVLRFAVDQNQLRRIRRDIYAWQHLDWCAGQTGANIFP